MMSCNNIIDDMYIVILLDKFKLFFFNVDTPKRMKSSSCLVVICLVLTFQVISE